MRNSLIMNSINSAILVFIVWTNFKPMVCFPTQSQPSSFYCSALTITNRGAFYSNHELDELYNTYNDNCIKLNAIKCDFNGIYSKKIDIHDRCCRMFDFGQCLESKCSNSSSVLRLIIDKSAECEQMGGEFKKCPIHQWFTYVVIFFVIFPAILGISIPLFSNYGKNDEIPLKLNKYQSNNINRTSTLKDGRRNG